MTRYMITRIRHIALIVAILIPATGHAETKEEWIALGARIHGGFGPFIPVGIAGADDDDLLAREAA